MDRGTVVRERETGQEYVVVRTHTGTSGFLNYVRLRNGRNFGSVRSAPLDLFEKHFEVVPEKRGVQAVPSGPWAIEHAP